jgi:cytoskeletal protein CcmA (bactofilin family)
VKGSVEGTITAVDRIHLDPTAKIKGHINSPKISVTDGALFDGEINMTSQATKPLYSPISDSSTPPKHAEDTEKK